LIAALGRADPDASAQGRGETLAGLDGRIEASDADGFAKALSPATLLICNMQVK
jgi:hypothetical protein